MTSADLAGESKTPPPPSQPPSRPPKTSPPPTKPPKQDADAEIFAAADALRADLARPSKPRPPSKPPRKPTNTKPIRGTHAPARQSDRPEDGYPLAGGPVQPPARTGKEPTPGSAAVTSSAVRGSAGVVAGAGASVPEWDNSEGGRAGGVPSTPGAVSGFVMPNTRVPLRFDEGRNRLVGAVGPSDPPDPQPIPNPHPYPPPVRPGLSWLPAVALPSLLLLAAVDYTAWAAWWI